MKSDEIIQWGVNEAEKDTGVIDGIRQCAGQRAGPFRTAETAQESAAGETNTQRWEKGQDLEKNVLT